jgi:hypothetical protein
MHSQLGNIYQSEKQMRSQGHFRDVSFGNEMMREYSECFIKLLQVLFIESRTVIGRVLRQSYI